MNVCKMKKIRNKVFETNSSSIHSVAVYRKNDKKIKTIFQPKGWK